MNHSDLICFRS